MPPPATDRTTPTDATAVRAHLASFLVRTDADAALLDTVMTRFRAARVSGERLTVDFAGQYGDDPLTVEASGPYRGPTDGIAPTVLDVIRVHNSVGWDNVGGGATAFHGYDDDGEPAGGGFEWEYLEDCEEDCAFLTAVAEAGLELSDVRAPFDSGQDWVLWHPTERNAHGEPMQYFFSHEGGDPQRRDDTYDLTLGQVLLRELAGDLGV